MTVRRWLRDVLTESRPVRLVLHRLFPSYALDYPLWVRATHWFNFLFFTMVARSGIAIFAAHPKLYVDEDSPPRGAWLEMTRKRQGRDELWCSSDEEVEGPPVLALPSGSALGLGRYWHFLGSIGWVATGVVYVGCMLFTRQWRRLIPRSTLILEDALRNAITYLRMKPALPGKRRNPLHPLDALQELSYFTVVFLLSPVMILTGLVQSPAVLARLPAPLARFENRQLARTVHGVGLVAYAAFVGVHLAMVVWHGFAKEMDKIVLGREGLRGTRRGAKIGLGIIGAVVAAHAVASVASRRKPRAVRRALATVVDPIVNRTMRPLASVPEYPEEKISPYFRVNGYPPISAYPQARGTDATYERLLADDFRHYRLEVSGLVEEPLQLSLEDIKAMQRREQTTPHQCIQGWSGIAKWAGVPLREVLRRCRPKSDARYVVFRSFGMHEQTGKPYYECLALGDALDDSAILAYEMNDTPLPLQHGAPLRLRFEKVLGFKMVKYLRALELVHDYRDVGEGCGGVREDEQHYDMGAYI